MTATTAPADSRPAAPAPAQLAAQGFTEADLLRADLDYLATREQRDARRVAEVAAIEHAYATRCGWSF